MKNPLAKPSGSDRVRFSLLKVVRARQAESNSARHALYTIDPGFAPNKRESWGTLPTGDTPEELPNRSNDLVWIEMQNSLGLRLPMEEIVSVE
jgi:hypothetical protein